MPQRSIHDNKVVSYEVDGERRRIVLHTRFKMSNRLESTDMIFEGVFAYRFEHDNFGNILFGVEELPVARLVACYRGLFEEGSKNAWPGPWNESTEACIEHLHSKGAKAFQISSSYGLTGWVISESYQVEPG